MDIIEDHKQETHTIFRWIQSKSGAGGDARRRNYPSTDSTFGIHPKQINSSKQQLIEQVAELFPRNTGASKENGQTTDDLRRVIGQLTAERKMMIQFNEKLSQTRQC
jgi:hypothetical protein